MVSKSEIMEKQKELDALKKEYMEERPLILVDGMKLYLSKKGKKLLELL